MTYAACQEHECGKDEMFTGPVIETVCSFVDNPRATAPTVADIYNTHLKQWGEYWNETCDTHHSTAVTYTRGTDLASFAWPLYPHPEVTDYLYLLCRIIEAPNCTNLTMSVTGGWRIQAGPTFSSIWRQRGVDQKPPPHLVSRGAGGAQGVFVR